MSYPLKGTAIPPPPPLSDLYARYGFRDMLPKRNVDRQTEGRTSRVIKRQGNCQIRNSFNDFA